MPPFNQYHSDHIKPESASLNAISGCESLSRLCSGTCMKDLFPFISQLLSYVIYLETEVMKPPPLLYELKAIDYFQVVLLAGQEGYPPAER